MDNNGIKKYEKSIINNRPMKMIPVSKPSKEYTIAQHTTKKIPQNILAKTKFRRGRCDVKSCSLTELTLGSA
tara:strand:+ start:125 stop:340 length:216 start_codon:yes stop_codon:yes gene_type:complete